jgi:hypothetical protein
MHSWQAHVGEQSQCVGVQKLVSNMHVRAGNTIAMQRLCDTYVRLSSPQVTLATPQSAHTVPRIQGMHVGVPPVQGALALAPVAYITAKSLGQVEAAVGAASTLPALFAHLHSAGEVVYGVVLPWGVLDTSWLLCAQYAHEFALFHARHNRFVTASPDTDKMSSDTITKLLQVPHPSHWRCCITFCASLAPSGSPAQVSHGNHFQ